MGPSSADQPTENLRDSAETDVPEECRPQDGGAAADPGGVTNCEKEYAFGGGAIQEDLATKLEMEEVSLSRGHSLSRSRSRASTENAQVTLSDMPVTVDAAGGHSKGADDSTAEKGAIPPAASSVGNNHAKGTSKEKLRFRSTLATFINDRHGFHGDWQAKEEAATAAAKELLEILAERVETLLTEAFIITGRLTQRKNTLRQQEIQRRASSKKLSYSTASPHEPRFSGEDETEGSGTGEGRTEDQCEDERGTDVDTIRSAAAGEADISIMKRMAEGAVESLLKVAIERRKESCENSRLEERHNSGSQCRRLDTTEAGLMHQGQKTAFIEERSFSVNEGHTQLFSQFSRSSLENYDAKNFPQDTVTYNLQDNQAAADVRREGVQTSGCDANLCEDPQLKRDKIWKIFGRETHAGRLLYQLYKPTEPGGDIIYPIPKSVKDLRGNPNFRVVDPTSSSSLAAAEGRLAKRRQVKVAVPRVGRHAARAAAAAANVNNNNNNKRFDKGNFLNGRSLGGKRTMKQIAKETENRRRQILEEASAHGVAAAAMGLKRDREKVMLLQRIPFSACSLLPEAARMPPLSPRERAVLYTEKVAADPAVLYSSRSPSPRQSSSKNNKNGENSNSTRKSDGRISSSIPRSTSSNHGRGGNKWEASLGQGTVDPCVQTLIPYVAAAKQRYRKRGVIDEKTGMTEEQKDLFMQTLREIQLRKQKLESLQKSLPDHVLAASMAPSEHWNLIGGTVTSHTGARDDCSSNTGSCSPSKGTSGPITGKETSKDHPNVFNACFSPDVAKSRLARRTILQQLQDEVKLKREIQARMKELETLVSISDAQRELQQMERGQ